jgi:NAD(P)H-hydrate epimerase
MARADAADREHRAVAVVCGRGNNGGDGLVVARHLFNWGLSPGVFLLGQKDKLTDDAASNLALLEREGLKVTPLFDESQWPMLEAALSQAGLVVDAVLGTGMTGVVRGQAAQAIEMINAARGRGAKVLALDCPSGLDCNTGEPLGACVEADETVTFGARKVGFRCGQAPRLCGRVTLVSIGLPRDLYRRHTPAPK